MDAATQAFGNQYTNNTKPEKHARALCDYQAKEEYDISFEKGDVLILLKGSTEHLSAEWLYARHMNPKTKETKIEGYVPRQHMRLEEPLKTLAGYEGHISKFDAEQRLLRCAVGAYLIREKPPLGKYVLSIHDFDHSKDRPNYVKNLIIRHGDNDNVYIEEHRRFKSIAELVDTYTIEVGRLCQQPLFPCRKEMGGQDTCLDEHYPSLPDYTILPNDFNDTDSVFSFLIAGNELIRILPNKKPQRRYFSINSEMTEIRWTPSCKKLNQALVQIRSIKTVRRIHTDGLRTQTGLYQDHCAFDIALVDKAEPMHLIARTPFEADVWVKGLTRLIKNTDRAADHYMLSARCSFTSYIQCGTEFIKLLSKGREHLRVYWLTRDSKELRWKPTTKATRKARIKIWSIKDVRPLEKEVVNQDVTKPYSCAFSIIYGSGNKTVKLVATNQQEADIWVTGLRSLIENGTEISNSNIANTNNSSEESHERPERDESDVYIYQNQIIIDHIKKELHDGRIVEMNMSIVEELKCRHTCDMTTVMEGQFGCIYFSRRQVPGFNLRVALKEIKLGQRSEEFGSITNAKISSRLMHFAIVPLLAYFEDKTHKKYYFLSPFFDNGDLFKMIQKDTLNVKSHTLTLKKRVKIMHQIASGIHYMHTGNPFRGTILHMDITTKKIVLDGKYNARLIDFGLARELKEGDESMYTDGPIVGTRGYFPTIKHSHLTKQHDYHNFGVGKYFTVIKYKKYNIYSFK
ncbi:hypothetical protein DPMN_135604 [Dreissena polymorpha]|uniref:Tyrosine-protein kinase n=1 Tax=Dreissena polymorpha TaxID=45954 RepID=A0A9D4G1A1_DREPO|nr:hypothetical protein DPMN_135604 [Dreissena polymorpha]